LQDAHELFTTAVSAGFNVRGGNSNLAFFFVS